MRRDRQANGSFTASGCHVDARNECGHDEVVDQVNHPFASLTYVITVGLM